MMLSVGLICMEAHGRRARRRGGGSILLYPESLMKWWNPFQPLKQIMTLVNTFEIKNLFVFLQQPNSRTEGGHW